MIIVMLVLFQLLLILWCYRLALRRNARRMQLWVCSHASYVDREASSSKGVHVQCHNQIHGMRLCGRCQEKLLVGVVPPPQR